MVATETTPREDVLDNWKRRDAMGDKGDKKDKENGPKQNVDKQNQLKQATLICDGIAKSPPPLQGTPLFIIIK